MVSSPFLASLLHLTRRTSRKSCARVYSDTPSPLQAFEVDLAASLQQLVEEHSHSSSELLSLTWMCKALDVVISAQSSTMQAVSMYTSSAARGRGPGPDKLAVTRMMEQYMEDSLKMLDVCGLVKNAVAGVEAYVKASHIALKRLQGLKLAQQGDIQRAKHALLSARHVQERALLHYMEAGASIHTHVTSTKRPQLSTCSSMLRRMGDKITAPAPTHTLSPQEHNAASIACSALYGGEMCTIFFLRLLSTALSPPASHKATTPLHMIGQVAAWAPSLLSLHAQLNSALLGKAHTKSQGRMTLFSELHTLEASMSQIFEALQEGSSSKQADLKHLVSSTSLLSHHLESSMARLEHQIECLLSSLVNIRMALLH